MGRFQHLGEEEILDNFTRGQIYGYILGNPGANYNGIRKALDLNNGTLLYHLEVLEKREYVHSYRDGNFKRFTVDRSNMPFIRTRSHKHRSSIKSVIGKFPGISQNEISESTGIKPGHVSQYVKELAEEGSVKVKRVGRKNSCSIV